MKKLVPLVLVLACALGLVGCNGRTRNIDFPFDAEDIESVEMYHYEGVPISAKMKVVVAESDIKTLFDMLEDVQLIDKKSEEFTGADVTSFRINLSDETSYELIYVCNGVKNGKLMSETGGFEYFTSAYISSLWDNLNKEIEAISVDESKLPRYKN